MARAKTTGNSTVTWPSSERSRQCLPFPPLRRRGDDRASSSGSGEGDVDGHHAVSIGKMDEAKLFYLMSRGLDLAEARRLVVEADLFPVLARISDEALKEEIAASIEGRIEDAD